MRRALIAMVVAAVAITMFAPGASAGDNFSASLSGDEENPPVETQGTGAAKFKLRDGGLVFKVNVANLEDIFAAHIHCGAVGVNGPVGVTLFAGGPVSDSGTLAEGTITAPDPGNVCGWETLADVIAAIESGDTYVNVHTDENPGGEIRGQLK